MSFLSINTSISQSWRASMDALMTILRRNKLATEETFSFDNYSPTIVITATTYNGLTARTRFNQINKKLDVDIYLTFNVTLASGIVPALTVTIPGKAARDYYLWSYDTLGASAAYIQEGTDVLLFMGAASGLGLNIYSLCASIEVK